MIPLNRLGLTLGGLSQGYQQSQQYAMQQALQQLALSQAQSEARGQTLASLALRAGLLNTGGGELNFLQPGQASAPSPDPSASPYQPAAAPAPQPQRPADRGSPDTAADAGIFDYNDAIAAQIANQGGPLSLPDVNVSAPAPSGPQQTQQGTRNLAPGARSAPDTLSVSETPGSQQTRLIGDQDYDTPGAPAGAAPTTTQTTAAAPPATSATPSAPAAEPTAAPSSGGGRFGMQIGGANGPIIDMATLFQRTDYQKLANGIAQLAPPGTSQADIYQAVVDLSKLAQGDRTQQQQAGMLARELLGGNMRLAEIGARGDIQKSIEKSREASRSSLQTQKDTAAGERTQAQIAGRASEGAANRESRERIAAAKNDLTKESQELRRQSMADKDKRWQADFDQRAERIKQHAESLGNAQAVARINAIKAQAALVKPDAAGNYTKLQRDQLAAYAENIAKIAESLAAP